MSKNKIVYLRWGDRYTEDHVERLRDQVAKNCSVDYDFITMDVSVGQKFDAMKALQEKYFKGTQDPESSITEDPTQKYKREDSGGIAHFRKVLMFMRDEEYEDDTKFLYLDLDSIITGDLAYFFNLDLEKPMILRSWEFDKDSNWKRLYHLRCSPYFNSSVLLWKKGQNRKIFNRLTDEKNIEANFFSYGIIDNWMHHEFGPYAYSNEYRNWFNFFEKGLIVSEDPSLENDKTIIKTLAGLTMAEKNKICLQS